MKRKIITLPKLFLFLILILVTLHLSPKLSLRTHLFITGHPKIAFNSEINELSTYSKRSKLFTLSPTPVDRATGNNKNAYKSTRVLIFYITTHHGGGWKFLQSIVKVKKDKI